jgi:hypothetical protein
MKKLFLIQVILFIILITNSAFSVTKNLDGKLGTGYATDPEKFGWQLNFAFLTELDPFFAAGFEPGIYWVTWDRKVGTENVGTSVEADVKADTDAYVIPLLADAQVRLPNLKDRIFVEPYVTLGLGYSIMFFNYSQPEYEKSPGNVVPAESKTKFFHGLTWQAMFGISYDPGPSSKIEFLAEVGYRYAKLKRDNLEVDMSGFIFNIGVRYPFGEAAPPVNTL